MRKGLTLLLCLATLLSSKVPADSTSPPKVISHNIKGEVISHFYGSGKSTLGMNLPENKDSIEPLLESGLIGFGEFCDKLPNSAMREFTLDNISYNIATLTVQDFTNNGWCTDCDLKKSVDSRTYVSDAVCLMNEEYPEVTINLGVSNKSPKKKPIKDCRIASFNICICDGDKLVEKYPSCSMTTTEIGLLSSREEVEEAYGKPSFTYNGDVLIVEYYKTNGDGIKFQIKDNQVVEITIEYYA